MLDGSVTTFGPQNYGSAVTLGGTVPINAAALEWDASAPPVTWRVQVDRWERLNTVRTWAAVVAFALLLAGLMGETWSLPV